MRRRSARLALACVSVLTMVLVATRGAATDYTVDTGSPCGLAEALQAADTDIAGPNCEAGDADDTITLKAGTYPLGSQSLTGKGSLTIQGGTGDPSDVKIDFGHSGRIGLDGGGTFVFADLTIANGTASGGGAHGGAIRARGVTLVARNVHFNKNTAGLRGGAISFYADDGFPGSLTLERSVFDSNLSQGLDDFAAGGAVTAQVYGAGNGVALSDVQFFANSAGVAAQGDGGALWLYVSGTGAHASCVRCTFEDNTVTSSPTSAAFGGAASLGADDHATVTMSDATFMGNNAVGAPGGSGQLVFVLSTVAMNHASIALERLLIHGSPGTCPSPSQLCTDVFLEGDFGATYDVLDSEFTAGQGRGITASDYEAEGSTYRFGHVTIAGYPNGGLAWNTLGNGTALLQNSIVTDNGLFNASAGPGTSFTATTNLIATDPATLFVNPTGPSYRLKDGSPAIDTGTITVTTLRPFDRNHGARVIGNATDIGAYEYGSLFADGFELGDGAWSGRRP